MKLISMREFVLEIEKTPIDETDWVKFNKKNLDKIFSYAEFLSQPLTLGMFVPCDLDGNVLEEPEGSSTDLLKLNEWNRAKERVLFEGFTVDEGMLKYNDRDTLFITRGNLVFYDGDDIYQLFTIEDIVFYGEDPELNQQAIKQIGG